MAFDPEALPVPLEDGWPVPLPDCGVVLRETGLTLGAILLDQDEWQTVRSAPVYSLRIDNELGLRPTAPVHVPDDVLTGARSLMEWTTSVHGAWGRLMFWDEGRTWWNVQEPDLELMLLCSPPGMFRNESDELSWWNFGTAEGKRQVDALCGRYGMPLQL